MFLSHIHNFRAYAIIGIVGAHCLYAFQWNDHPVMFRFFDTLFNQSSLLFFFIAGFMFQYLSPRYEKFDYWQKKIKNVICPYLLLSIPSIIYYTQFAVQDNTWEGFYDYPLYKQVFFFLITGKHLAPFWFVPTIALFYIISPLLIRIDKHRGFYYFLPVFMAISFYLGRGGQYGPINKAIYLFSVYLFGMFVCIHHDRVLEIARRYRYLLALSCVALLVSNMFIEGYEQYIQYVLKILMCVLVLYWLNSIDGLIGTRLNYLGHISFGIFFIHAYVLPVVKILYLKVSGQPELPEGNLVGYLLLTTAILLGCMGIIYLCQKVFGARSRMILGA